MRWLIGLALAGCTLEGPPDDYALPMTIARLRQEQVHNTTVRLDEVVVTSTRTRSGTSFFVQDPGGGPGTGLQVTVGGALFRWPPPIGAVVSLTGVVTASEQGPSLILRRGADAVDLRRQEQPLPTPWEEGPLGFDLAAVPDLTVTSAPDPTGRARTDGPVELGGAFGITPGWAAQGDARGIVLDDRLHLRHIGDWSGDLEGEPPVEAEIAEVRAGRVADGTPVRLADLVQITPWSQGDRFAVLQDGAGHGIWADAEGWGVSAEAGDLGSWVGEVRRDGEGLRLRVWHPPELVGSGAPIPGRELVDGAWVLLHLEGLIGPDAQGTWQAGDLWLDDRFLPLDDLPDPVVVQGVVRETPEGPRLCVLAFEPG